jgi:hypothetical protein
MTDMNFRKHHAGGILSKPEEAKGICRTKVSMLLKKQNAKREISLFAF